MGEPVYDHWIGGGVMARYNKGDGDCFIDYWALQLARVQWLMTEQAQLFDYPHSIHECIEAKAKTLMLNAACGVIKFNPLNESLIT
jgi:hypothetical protein